MAQRVFFLSVDDVFSLWLVTRADCGTSHQAEDSVCCAANRSAAIGGSQSCHQASSLWWQICTRRTPRKGSNEKTGNMFRATDIYTYINHRPIRYKLLIIQERTRWTKQRLCYFLYAVLLSTARICCPLLPRTDLGNSARSCNTVVKQAKGKKKNQIALFKQVTLSSPHLYRLLYWRDERNDVPRLQNRCTRSATFTFAKLDLQVCAGLCRQITFVAKLTRMKANKSMKWFRQNHLLRQQLSQPRSSRCSAPPTLSEER